VWSWELIHNEWLLGGSIGVQPEDIVAAFNAAERVLGNDWIKRHRITASGVVVAGATPTLSIVATGRALAVIDGRPGAPQLVERLKAGDRAAFVELKAIYMCCVGLDGELEIGTEVAVGEHSRKPDFRVRQQAAPWTYVEVAAPDISEVRQQAEAVMHELAAILPAVPSNTAIDLFLRRDLAEAEVESVKNQMLELGTNAVAGDYDIGFGVISVNMSHPSTIEPREFGAEPYTPRLGLSKAESVGGQPANKRVSIRYPYSDERAEEFLTREARQLSRESPGLVMLSLSGTVAAFRTWRPLLLRRLQPNLHTRVSAICLFHSGIETTANGEDVVTHMFLIENAYALHKLPAWIIAALKRFEAA
jgi:hypothetical protein